MNITEETLNSLSLFEIGMNLLLGDIPTDLAELLTNEQQEQLTQIRNQIGVTFVEKSGLKGFEGDWAKFIEKLSQ